MATKVFISWSGPLTQKIAAELNGWIPKMLQSVQTYFTPDDIEKGAHWSKSSMVYDSDLRKNVKTIKSWTVTENAQQRLKTIMGLTD